MIDLDAQAQAADTSFQCCSNLSERREQFPLLLG